MLGFYVLTAAFVEDEGAFGLVGGRLDPSVRWDDEQSSIWIPTERLPQFTMIFPAASCNPPVSAPPDYAAIDWTRETALVDVVRGCGHSALPSASSVIREVRSR